jgi:hypothetical protein
MRVADEATGVIMPFTGTLYWPGFKLGHAGGLKEDGMPCDKVVMAPPKVGAPTTFTEEPAPELLLASVPL